MKCFGASDLRIAVGLCVVWVLLIRLLFLIEALFWFIACNWRRKGNLIRLECCILRHSYTDNLPSCIYFYLRCYYILLYHYMAWNAVSSDLQHIWNSFLTNLDLYWLELSSSSEPVLQPHWVQAPHLYCLPHKRCVFEFSPQHLQKAQHQVLASQNHLAPHLPSTLIRAALCAYTLLRLHLHQSCSQHYTQ